MGLWLFQTDGTDTLPTDGTAALPTNGTVALPTDIYIYIYV
jgi:hypothetical protein